MRILIIEYRDLTHPEAGGAELILFEIFGRLVRAGHEADYLCTMHPGAKPEEKIQGLNVIRRGGQAFFNFTVPRVYRKELRQRHYDVIVEGIDKLPYFLPVFEKRVPFVCVIPHLFGTTVFREVGFLKGSYVLFYERFIPFVYRQAKISVLSGSTRHDLIARGLPVENVRMIHPGLNHELYTAPATKPLANHPIVIYLGRIKKYKGVDIGMQAVALLRERYPDIEYQIVGTGSYVPDLHRLAQTLHLENNVSFLGHKAGKEKVALLQRANVVVYPSPKEGWGLSVIEANACGTPAVVSNSPGLQEAAVDGETGFLVTHGDARALADKIERLLADPQLYDRLRANAIAWARKFTWERATDQTLALIQEAIASRKELGKPVSAGRT